MADSKRFVKKFIKGNLTFLFVAILIAWGAWFVATSPHFERTPPKIETPNMSYYNLKWDIPIAISDESGIRSYQVALVTKDSEKILLNRKGSSKKEVRFNLPIPKINIKQGDKLTYKITARDSSNYGFFMGNESEKILEIAVDTQLPQINIIQMSNVIIKGGAAAVVFYADDDAIANISLTNGYQSFVAFPFHKPNYYLGIIPWYIHNPQFKGAIVAQDKAGNTRRFSINFMRYNRNYRISNLPLKQAFIDGKITEIIENENLRTIDSFENEIAKFRYVNEGIRAKDSSKIAHKILNTEREVDGFETFKPTNNARVVGLFGDYRKFSFNRVDAGESHHLGVDLAGLKNMPVITSNDGVVVLSEELGIHGNAVIIEHGFGVASLYAHLSESLVKEGDIVKKGDIIAKTGASGLAFGDHLHFSVLIQGVPSISNEWMDSRWLKTHINDIIKSAKEIIDSNNASDTAA